MSLFLIAFFTFAVLASFNDILDQILDDDILDQNLDEGGSDWLHYGLMSGYQATNQQLKKTNRALMTALRSLQSEESVGGASNGAPCSRDVHSSCSSGYCKTIAGSYGRRTYECAAKLSNGARCPSNHNACLSGNCLRYMGRNSCKPQAEVQAVAGETDVSQLNGVKYVEPQADNVCSEGSSWSSALQRCVSTTGKDCGLCISTCTAMPRYSGSACRAMCASDCQEEQVGRGSGVAGSSCNSWRDCAEGFYCTKFPGTNGQCKLAGTSETSVGDALDYLYD